MANNTSTIKSLEQGRATFAYECAYQVLSIQAFEGQKLKTGAMLQKLFENKFRNKIEIDEKKDNENKKKEKEENRKILNEFLAEPLKKIKDYSSGDEIKIKRDIANFYEKTKKEYKSHVKKIPMLIKTNGVGATFAFMLSKGGIYTYIGEQVLEWLKNDEKGVFNSAHGLDNFEQLVKEVTQCESPEYRALTNEVIAFFIWLRRFAEGLIEGEAENE